MPILILFALLAGAGTALSPCVLPVLPALLSATGSGGRRRPLGVVVGLSITFTATVIGAATLVDGVGLGANPLRLFAVAVLLIAGLMLFIPGLAAHIEAPLSRLARFGPKPRGEGFASGLLVGGALGFVYTPCASPILAAIISVSAASGSTVALALAYSAGSAVVLLALSLGGRRLFARLRNAGRGPSLQRALGAIMVLTAVAFAANLDVNFDQWVAENIPNVNATAALECSRTITSRLHEITGRKARFVAANGQSACEGSTSGLKVAKPSASQAELLASAKTLPVLGEAPEFTDTQNWFNTAGDRPLSVASLRGRVVLVDFWTYTCINCIRTLPYLKAWTSSYAKDGLTIVGVETPEFAFEREAGNVRNAISQFGINYPVVQDNEMGTWDAYGNQYWPADYLIDAKGRVRYASAGEGDYEKTETAIRALLAEAGYQVGGSSVAKNVLVPSNLATPETYLGTARAEGWRNPPLSGVHDYGQPPQSEPKLNQFIYSGSWKIEGQPAEALSGARIDAEVQAKNAYLVLSPPAHAQGIVKVLLNGRPISPTNAGSDVRNGAVAVTAQRLYHLVSLPSEQRFHLTLELSAGTTGFAFTFG